MKLSQIVNKNLTLVRDGEFELLAQCTIDLPKKILTFIEDFDFIQYINMNKSISCVICKYEHVDFFDDKLIGIVCTNQPKLTFFKLHNSFVKTDNSISSYPTKIGRNCMISSQAVIASKNVTIGNNVTIEENVVIRENVEIGDNCIIRVGSIIGGQGYEFKRDKGLSILQVEHAGKIIIEDSVEIKELCSIHQAVFDWDYTKIGEHSKLDAHTHVGHATKIGKRVMIGSHSNLAGNINVEDDVYIGPGVTISNRLNIGCSSRISLGSVVTKDVEKNKTVTGNFAIDHDIFLNNLKKSLI